jgi:3-hydroxybutyryl-CoA dehydratase
LWFIAALTNSLIIMGPKVGDVFTHDITYTQEQVNLYAQISGDTNPLHIDVQAGKDSMFGKNIIHGHFSASVFTKIFGVLYFADGHIYMKQSCMFLKPMFVDTLYQAVITVKEIYPEKNRVLYETKVIDPITGSETIVGEALLMNKTQYVW